MQFCLMHIVLMLFVAALVPVEDARLISRSGESLTGELQQLDPTSVRIAGVDHPISQTVSLGFDRTPVEWKHDGAECYLVDDSKLVVESWTIRDQVVEVKMPCGEMLQIKSRDVRAIKTRQQPQQQSEAWQAISLSKPTTGDAIIIQRGGALETLEGRIGDVEDDKVGFTLDETTANINLKKIEGLVFYHATGRELVSPVCQLKLVDGSTLNLRDFSFRDGQFACESVAGVTLTLNLSSLDGLHFGLGRAVYLSELEPASVEWSPLMAGSTIASYLRQMSLPKTDRAFDGNPLSLIVFPDPNFPGVRERREFSQGLAVKSGTKIAFALDEQYKRLTGLVGFDPQASASGNVRLTIRCDGQRVFDQAMTNEQFANPVDLDLDVEGISRLVIEVDYHDGRTVGDVLHFCDLKAVK